MAAGIGAAIAGGAATGGLGMIGSAVSAHMARTNMREQNRFNYQMAATAHQRQVADMRLAGLNPILSAGGGGAPTPTTAAPGVPDMGQHAGAALQGALQIKRLAADLKLLKAQTRKTMHEGTVAKNKGTVTDVEAQVYEQIGDLLRWGIPKAKAWMNENTSKSSWNDWRDRQGLDVRQNFTPGDTPKGRYGMPKNLGDVLRMLGENPPGSQ